jgi:polygalacturonase
MVAHCLCSADGLDIDAVQNALIEENFFDVDDDALCVKSGTVYEGRAFGRPARDILFRNNVIGRGHGITVGSETSADVYNVTFDNITMTNTGTGIRMKSERGRGGIVSGVTYRNIDMVEIQGQCVQITLNYHGGNLTPVRRRPPPIPTPIATPRSPHSPSAAWCDNVIWWLSVAQRTADQRDSDTEVPRHSA